MFYIGGIEQVVFMSTVTLATHVSYCLRVTKDLTKYICPKTMFDDRAKVLKR